MRFLKMKFCLTALLGMAMWVAGPSAKAEFLNEFSGNTAIGNGASPNGVVSFATIKNDGAGLVDAVNTAFGTTYSTGDFTTLFGASIDNNANFLYLYQVVNNSGDVQQLNVSNPSLYTSAGYMADTRFTDAEGAVDTGNRGLGTNPANGSGDVLDGNPTFQFPAGPTGVSLTTGAGTTYPGSGLSVQSATQFFRFLFDPELLTETSPILFLTSQFGPSYQQGRLIDGATTTGDIVTAVTPVPGTLVLWGVGLAGAYGFSRRRLTGRVAPAPTA